MEHLNQLKTRLADVINLQRTMAVLGWDQRTYLPVGGGQARAAQMATLARITHEMFTAEATALLLQAAAEEVANLSPDSDEAALVRVAQRDYDQRTKLPADLVAEQTHTSALARQAWVKARAENDYTAFAPWLEQQIDLAVQRADCLGYEDDLYDALLDLFEPEMKTAEVAAVFAQLKEKQIALVKQIEPKVSSINADVISGQFPAQAQYAFIMNLIPVLGYDLDRGRLDETVHPFCTSFSRDDVRITTRYNPQRLNAALFGAMHETGHALYNQGVGEAYEGTVLNGGTSLGIHESQSRLWENLVGRSRGFWGHFYGQLQAAFPQPFGSLPLDGFYRAINRVEPSLIRVEADEVTYNLHIIIRFELERDLLAGKLNVADAPDAWNDKYAAYLGVTPPNNSLGILQDTHWSGGSFGYFPTYALGNLMSVQIFNKAVETHPDIPRQIAQGHFETLLGWLQNNVYIHGRKYLPVDLLQRVTGSALDPEPYLDYLHEKYGEIYGL